MSGTWAGSLFAVGLLAVSACGSPDGGAAPTPRPAAAPITAATAPPTSATATSAPGTTSDEDQPATLESNLAAGTGEVYLDASSGQLIHRDSNGVYICVILRPDDLAALRARATQRSDVEE